MKSKQYNQLRQTIFQALNNHLDTIKNLDAYFEEKLMWPGELCGANLGGATVSFKLDEDTHVKVHNQDDAPDRFRVDYSSWQDHGKVRVEFHNQQYGIDHRIRKALIETVIKYSKKKTA